MAHTEKVCSDGPVTRNEMGVLLQPLQSCLKRIESALEEFSRNLHDLPSPKEFTFSSESANPARLSLEATDVEDVRASRVCELPASRQEGDKTVTAFDCGQTSETQQEEPQSPSSAGRKRESLTSRDGEAPRSYFDLDHAPTKDHWFHEAAERSRIGNMFQHSLSSRRTSFKPYFNKIYAVGEDCFQFFNSLEEPERKGWLIELTRSRLFDILCMMAITFNSGLVAYVADWQIRHVGKSEPGIHEILEYGCLVYFSLELILRIAAHRCYFFVNDEMYWNIFDFVLVIISLVDFVFDKLMGALQGSNVGFMRLLRLLKLARIFRSLRSFRFFKSLAVMMESFQKSFISLFWGLVMLAFVLYLFSLIFMQALVEYLNFAEDVGPDRERLIMRRFGSLARTILSLYMSVTGGDDWSIYYDILSEAGVLIGLAFVLFTFFFLFALFNILTGTLVEKAMSTSKQDRTDLVMNQRKKFNEQKGAFMEICNAMDADKDGKISWDEFEEWICNPVMLAYMAHLGIEVHDVELFFNTVGARMGRSGKNLNQGEITIEHFVEGCMHMKGSATAIDMQRQLFEMHILHNDVAHLEDLFINKIQQLERMIVERLGAPSVPEALSESAVLLHTEQTQLTSNSFPL